MRRRHDTGTISPGASQAVPSGPPIERKARERIGQNLRLLYTSVLTQPLPDRFTRLLDDLSQSTPTRSDDNSREGA